MNGLQTTTTIYNYFYGKNVASKDKKRSILVRIIVTEDSETRDRIIKATNFQTYIPVASLRATDCIQRDIEDYFLRHEWFYDRRKNFYKNTGKPSEKIISIPYLAQAVMSVILGEPDNARARPSSLIKRDDEYTRVFSESLSLGGYLACARMMKKIDTFIRASSFEYSMQQKSNLKFHLAMLVTVKLIGKTSYKPVEVVSMLETKLSSLQEDILNQALSEIIGLVYKYANSQERLIDIDRIAKSKEFVNYLLVNVSLSHMKLE